MLHHIKSSQFSWCPLFNVLFNSYELCNGYVESYKESLEGGLKRGFPEVIETEIRCVDAHTALELQQNFEEREKQLWLLVCGIA